MKQQDYGKWTKYWDYRRYEINRYGHIPRQPYQFPFLWAPGHVIVPPGYSWDWYQHGKAIVGPHYEDISNSLRHPMIMDAGVESTLIVANICNIGLRDL